MKMYKYTLYKQNGTVQDLGVSKEKEFSELYKILNCRMLEHIPSVFYPKGFGHSTVWGDEEARLKNSSHRNPHFKVITDIWGNECDVVGDLIKQELVKNK